MVRGEGLLWRWSVVRGCCGDGQRGAAVEMVRGEEAAEEMVRGEGPLWRWSEVRGRCGDGQW